MSNDDLVSKIVAFYILREVVLQTDVLLGKPRDFRAFRRFLGLPIESLSLFSILIFYMRLIFALHIMLFYVSLCQCEVFVI